MLFNISDSSATENGSVANQRSESASAFAHSCHCVAFRLDDVQDYFLNQAQMEVIRTFEGNNASLTIGIIGNHIGDDKPLTTFLKDEIAQSRKIDNSTMIEVANHGWNHEDFTLFDKEMQSELIQNSNSKIIEAIGVKPSVFIPPFNSLNNGTITAVHENGIQYISANATSYPPFLLQYENKSDYAKGTSAADTIFHFPSTAATGYLNSDNRQWYGNLHNDTFKAIKEGTNKFGYAVVTMHPQEYSSRDGLGFSNEVDHAQIHELELLIDDIRGAGFKIVTISQIKEAYGSSIPEFSSHSIGAILAASIVIVIWLSAKGDQEISKYFSSRSNSASF